MRHDTVVCFVLTRRKDSNTGEEVNQFFTLLHTTLKLTDQDSPPQTPPDLSSGNPPSDPFKPDQRSKLSPVVELSESSISTVTEQDGPTSEVGVVAVHMKKRLTTHVFLQYR